MTAETNKEEKKEQEVKQKKEKSEEQEKIEELTDILKRLQAEFENYKKRVAKESSEFIRCASADLIKKLLPVLDSFEQAIKNKESKEFVKGVELIFAQLSSVLAEAGLKKIECEGKCFDPYCHEVLLQEESDKDGIVLEELQKGYAVYGNVIRTAKVKVGKKRQEDEK
jgi:molecular chaperone GrpE